MASLVSSTTSNEDFCELCASKYERSRPSLCQCKHCSKPLCFDCMKDHKDELLQNINHLFDRYNQLIQSSNQKQTLMDDETTQKTMIVDDWYDKYIKDLTEAKEKILQNIQRTKDQNKALLFNIDSNLRTIGDDLQMLSKDNNFQPTQINSLSKRLEKTEEELRTHGMRNEDSDPLSNLPKFNLALIENSISPKTSATSSDRVVQASCLPMTPLNETPSTQKPESNKKHEIPSMPPMNIVQPRPECIYVPYTIDRIASDGKNILYSSQGNADVIVHVTIQGREHSELCRPWNQSTINDMIWWQSIGKYVCATNEGVYTVEYVTARLKIIAVIRDSWSYSRVAAYSDLLWVWINTEDKSFNGINVYSDKFQRVQTIDFKTESVGLFTGNSTSFCVTDEYVASLRVRWQNNCQVFQINICDWNMRKVKTVLLGECTENTEIRAHPNGDFLIATGLPLVILVNANGEQWFMNQEENCEALAILDNHTVAISNGINKIQIISLE